LVSTKIYGEVWHRAVRHKIVDRQWIKNYKRRGNEVVGKILSIKFLQTESGGRNRSKNINFVHPMVPSTMSERAPKATSVQKTSSLKRKKEEKRKEETSSAETSACSKKEERLKVRDGRR